MRCCSRSITFLMTKGNNYPFGMGIRGEWKFVQPQIGGVNQYLYNGKELNDDFGLNWNDYGARWYDAGIGRWGGVDPLAEKYSHLSSYNYVANNPLKYIDPDGRYIVIAWEINGETHTMIYSYEKDRKIERNTPKFVANTLKSLDQLYSTGALEIVINEGEEATNMMDAFMKSREHHVMIKKSNRNVYIRDRNTIGFDDNHGRFSKKDVHKGLTKDNISLHSASALLGHEFIHAYNDEFDHENYMKRRSEEYESTIENLFFDNKEEIETTLN